MDEFILYLKNNLFLNGFTVLKTNYNKVVIFKSYTKYSKCIYLNFKDSILDISVSKVFDSSEYYISIDSLIISNTSFNNIYDSFDYIQNNITL